MDNMEFNEEEVNQIPEYIWVEETYEEEGENKVDNLLEDIKEKAIEVVRKFESVEYKYINKTDRENRKKVDGSERLKEALITTEEFFLKELEKYFDKNKIELLDERNLLGLGSLLSPRDFLNNQELKDLKKIQKNYRNTMDKFNEKYVNIRKSIEMCCETHQVYSILKSSGFMDYDNIVVSEEDFIKNRLMTDEK